MKSIFGSVPVKTPSSNKFDLSHERKFSLNMGELIPILAHEIMPGDKFNVRSEIMMRFAPMLAPVMHRIDVTTHYFFVPYRLLWDEWEDFITGGRLGTSAPVFPVIPINTAFTSTPLTMPAEFMQSGSLMDYLVGLTLAPGDAVVDSTNISALWFRAYQLIWDEWYRDQNLTPSLDVSKSSGIQTLAQAAAIMGIRQRAWRKDYFTSALPFTQRGPEALIPMEGEADVTYKNPATVNGAPAGADQSIKVQNATINIQRGTIGSTGTNTTIENLEEVLFQNGSVTINDLRRSFALQRFLEKMARGGGRYIEQIFAMFGVTSSDARLQRPEYLGGGRQPCVISEVLSSFQADGGTIPQGNMAGHGISIGNTNGFTRRFEEHGVIMGIMSVLPKTGYMNPAINKFARKFDKFDYPWPDFAHIGEQAIQTGELAYDQSAAAGTSGNTFGYTPRYAEYKNIQSTVHGDFRETLKYWHMDREFETVPVLNENFVTADPTLRIFNVIDPSADHLYCQCYNKISAVRKLPYFGVPI